MRMDFGGENLAQWARKKNGAVAAKKSTKLYVSKHDPSPSKINSSFGPNRVVSSGRKKKMVRHAPVPQRSERAQIMPRTRKNFVMANAIETILAANKLKKNVKSERFANKPGFGKVPEYLSDVKRQVQEEKEFVAEIQRQIEIAELPPSSHCEDLDCEERLQVLHQLQDMWGDVNAEYQKSAHQVNLDTMAKRKKKAMLEEKLDALHKAIEKLSPGKIQLVLN